MGKRRVRRHFSDGFKKQVVAETYVAGTSVSVVARRHDINANLLFRWRDDPRYSGARDGFLPIEIDVVSDTGSAICPIPSELAIWIAGDVRLALKGDYDPQALGVLVRTIRKGC